MAFPKTRTVNSFLFLCLTYGTIEEKWVPRFHLHMESGNLGMDAAPYSAKELLYAFVMSSVYRIAAIIVFDMTRWVFID